MNKKGIGFLAIFLIVVVVLGAGFAVYKIATIDKVNDEIQEENINQAETNQLDTNENVEEVIDTPIYEEPIVCVSNWSCSSYSSCKKGEKTRTCTDLNNCEIQTEKPSLIRKCSSGGGSPAPVVIPDIFNVLVLTHKNLVDWTPTGEENSTLTINYTLSGKTFQVFGVPENYTAVYYPNRFNYSYWDGLIFLPNDVVTNLPMVDDINGDVNLSDYCNNTFNPDALNCIGAKIWVVPSEDVVNNTLTWVNPNEYYFETDLINYTRT